MHARLRPAALWLAVAFAPAVHAEDGPVQWKEQVTQTERAFAKTMADRDLKGFESFLADDTVFFSGPQPLRGKRAVVERWKRLYEGPKAPFSWEPDQVEVLDDGTLAHSSGPVRNPEGKIVSRFNSVWRKVAPGVWRIVFDRGEPVCDCAAPKN